MRICHDDHFCTISFTSFFLFPFLSFFLSPLCSFKEEFKEEEEAWGRGTDFQDKGTRFAVAPSEQRARNSGISECLTTFVVHRCGRFKMLHVCIHV